MAEGLGDTHDTGGSDGAADAEGRHLPVPLPSGGFGAPHRDDDDGRPAMGDPDLRPEDAARLQAAREAHNRVRAVRRHKRRFWRLMFLGLMFVGLLFTAELIGRAVIPGLIADEFSVRDAASMNVELSGAGIVPRAVVLGTLDDVTIVYDDLDAGSITVPEMSVEIAGADLDVSDLLARRLTINGADGVRVVAAFDADAVTRLVGFESAIRGGEVLAGGLGRDLQVVDGQLDGRVVRFQGGFSSFDLPVPEERWLPCDPVIQVVDDTIRLECRLDELPPAMGGPIRP